MGHFSMEIYAPSGSNLSGNQQSVSRWIEITSTNWIERRETRCKRKIDVHKIPNGQFLQLANQSC